ncbi:MAG: DUF1553 domain-containing protein, partial [Planctomycetota bacterium]|nr:DUF1553 domain-containing protein [Planctomycetota bacterium]
TRWSARSVETVDPNVATIEELRNIKREIRDELATSWLGSRDAIVGKFLALKPPAVAKSADAKLTDAKPASTLAPFPTTLGELWHRQTASLQTATQQASTPQATSPQTTGPANASLLGTSAKIESAAVVTQVPAASTPVPPLSMEDFRAEHDRRAAANKANLTLWVDFTPAGNNSASGSEANTHESPDPTARWRWDGLGMEHGQVADGELVIAAAGDRAINQILPAGRWSHVWSQRLAGALRSPLLDAKAARTFSIGYVAGKFAAQAFIIDQAFHSERMKFINQPNFGWLKLTAGDFLRLGGTIDTLKRRVYFEMTTKSLNNYFPPRVRYNGVTEKDLTDPNSWFGVSRIYQHAPDKGPVDELARLEAFLAEEELPPSREAWANRFADTLLSAVERLRDGESTAEDVLLLNEALAAKWLSNDAKQSSKLTELVARYREAEAKLQPERTIGSAAEWNEATDERIAIRGSYEEFGDEVRRGHIRLLAGNAALNAADSSATDKATDRSSGRLKLAHLIASNDNPLTARVLVNRLWLQLFGEGIVRTPDDFGHLGEPPTHPELLDWLAHRFVQENWSLKKQIRLIVTSRTWRQSGQTVPAALTTDPENRLWHHRPVRRLDAEAIRDSLLAVSGRLSPELGGPPIDPYRTAEDGDKRLFRGPLDGNGRRSIYQKMTLMEPPKFLAIFNQPLPKLTTGKRDTTNVPDQALALLNDPFVIAMAKHWSEQVLNDGSSSPQQRAERMVFAAFGRPPQPAEIARLVKLVEQCTKLRGGDTGEMLTYQPAWQDAAHALFNAKAFVYVD